MQALAVHLNGEQAQPALVRVLDRMKNTTGADKLRAQADAAQALARQLSTEQAKAALGKVIEAMAGATDPGQLRALVQTLEVLPAAATLEQINQAIVRVQNALGSNAGGEGLMAAAEATEILAPRLPLALASKVMSELLDRIETSAGGDELKALTRAAVAVASRLELRPAEPPSSALWAQSRASRGRRAPRPSPAPNMTSRSHCQRSRKPSLSALGGARAGGLRRTGPVPSIRHRPRPDCAARSIIKDLPIPATTAQVHEAMEPWANSTVQQLEFSSCPCAGGPGKLLVPQIRSGQATEDLQPIVNALAASIQPEQLRALGGIAKRYLPGAATESIENLVAALLESIWRPRSNSGPERALTFALKLREELQSNSEREQLDSTSGDTELGFILKAVVGTITTAQIDDLLSKLQQLPINPAPEEMHRIVDAFMDAIAKSSDADVTEILVRTFMHLPLGTAAQEAKAALSRLLSAAGKAEAMHQRQGQAERPPAVEQTPEQARAALALALQALAGATTPYEVESRARDVERALPVDLNLTAAEALGALDPILRAMAGATDTYELETLAQAMLALAPKLTAQQVGRSRLSARSALGWATTGSEASAWARVLVALAQHDFADDYVPNIVEALKYPTAVGRATTVLLAPLQSVKGAAPGKKAEFATIINWIRGTYPQINLDKPPDCPEPMRPALACPGTTVAGG